MQKIFKSLGNLLIALLIIVMLVPGQVFAAGRINTAAATSLTLNFIPEEIAAEGTEFRLHRVANVSSSGKFTATTQFAEYQLDFGDMNEESWREMAAALQGYIAADKIAATATAKVDENGVAAFKELPVGLYFVAGDVFRANGKYYTPQAFLICLPNLDENDDWMYDVETSIKYESEPEPGKDEESPSLEILKVWKDDDYSGRPESVTIEIYKDEELYKTVTLNEDNDWRYKLKGIDKGAVWSVKEKDVPDGYRVVIENQTGRIVVNNVKPDIPETPTTPEEKLPQTGVLWWPVPMLIAAGLVFILLGYLRRRGNENE